MYLGYFPSFQLIRQYCRTSTTVKFDFNELYQRQTPRNHCIISTANGPLKLSVPVTRPFGGSSPMSTIMVDNSKKWRIEHWRSLQSAYQHAPYFEHYAEDIRKILFQESTHLVDFNLTFLKFFSTHLAIGQVERIAEAQILFQPDQTLGSNPVSELNYPSVFKLEQFFDKETLSILDGLFNLGPMVRLHL